MTKLKTLGSAAQEEKRDNSVAGSSLPDMVEGSVHAREQQDRLNQMTAPKEQVPLGSDDQSESQPTPREKK